MTPDSLFSLGVGNKRIPICCSGKYMIKITSEKLIFSLAVGHNESQLFKSKKKRPPYLPHQNKLTVYYRLCLDCIISENLPGKRMKVSKLIQLLTKLQGCCKTGN